MMGSRALSVLLVAVFLSGCGRASMVFSGAANPPIPLFEVPIEARVRLKVFLQGSYDSAHSRMKGRLQARGFLPTSEPYSALGYAHHHGGGGETTDPSVLANSQSDGVEDWIVVELRSPAIPSEVMATRSALLLKNGSVVDVDGTSDVLFSNMPSGSYYIAVAHRNHLGVMTEVPVRLSEAPDEIDFSNPAVAIYGGADGRRISGSDALLYAGDVNRDGRIMYTGSGNDRDPILAAIGGTIPTNTVSGYRIEDVNLDGTVMYTGAGNDRDVILAAIGGVTPTAVRLGTVPR